MSQDANFGSWAVAESPLTIEYSLVVLEEIRHAVTEGFQRLSRGRIEVGGVLYGTHERSTVQIQAMREIVCEHARGPSFLLSDNDRAALTEQLARDQENHRLEGMVAMGWFLFHPRGEIALTESDLETFDAFFPAPWQITLVIRPGRMGLMRAGFFVRESDGTVKSERSYLDFSFPDRPAVPDRPPPNRGAPGDRRNAFSYDVHPDTMPSAPHDVPLFGQPSASIPQYLPYPETHRKWPWVLIPVVLAAVLAILGLRLFAPRPAPEPISLSVAERDGQLQIQWNHSSRSITGAARGTLEITDGQDSRSIPLAPLDLSHGSFNYLRNSGDVEIHMTVEDSAGEKTQEASRFLGSPPVAADPNELDAIRLERDSLQDEIVRLRARNKQQGDRSASAEKTTAESAQKANNEPPKTERAKVEPPKSEAPKAERAAPEPSSGGPSGTYLQLAATSKSEAEIMVDALRRKQFESLAAEIPEHAGTYRVLVGPVRDGNVNKLRADLQDAGFPGNGAIKRMF